VLTLGSQWRSSLCSLYSLEIQFSMNKSRHFFSQRHWNCTEIKVTSIPSHWYMKLALGAAVCAPEPSQVSYQSTRVCPKPCVFFFTSAKAAVVNIHIFQVKLFDCFSLCNQQSLCKLVGFISMHSLARSA
jgi:hypothetical protein